MSFSAVATYTTDKSADMFGQSGFEDLGSDFFDQFITYSPEDEDFSIVPNSTYLENISDSHSGDLSLSSTDDEAKHFSYNPWRGEARPHNNSGASLLSMPPGSQFYSELSGRAAISDSELLSLEDINLESPLLPAFTATSLPPSPSPNASAATRRKNRIAESLSKTFKRATANLDVRLLRSPIKKSSSSSKMTRASNKSSLDLWGDKIDKLQLSDFDFETQANILPLSPPASAKLPVFKEEELMTPAPGKHLNGFAYRNASNQHANTSSLYDTPLATPKLEAPTSRNVSQRVPADLYPVTPQTQNTGPTWSQLPNSPDFASLDTNTMYPLSDLDSPLWYGHANTTPIAQPSPSGFHTNPQRATKSLAMQLQNDLAFSTNDLALSPMSGLGIHMPISNMTGQSFTMGSPPMIHNNQNQQVYFPTPNHHSQPQQAQPHGHHQRHPSMNQHQTPNRQQGQGHRRHQSQPHPQSQMPGQSHSPIRKPQRPVSRNSSSSPSPSPTSHLPNFAVRKRKNAKNNKPSTPRTPTAAIVDFVNYTPNDSRKILTGVAPSGSSKTKARREKEAAEKRRKLSQAAVRARKGMFELEVKEEQCTSREPTLTLLMSHDPLGTSAYLKAELKVPPASKH
ncbi:hypothetical protein BDZ45DRAFT_685867 [Acephala macrosclerotiorum]|nr:hypothetical protein BDZ45DRAFT_685867 [Acephala macrosclerotiorum]